MSVHGRPSGDAHDRNIVIIMQEGGMEGLVDGQLDNSLSGTGDSNQDPTVSVTIGNPSYSQSTSPLLLSGQPQEGASTLDSTNCYVCGDRASGYHYSVFSCEGCKGFFKRTVQKNLVYSCKEAKNCVINKYTRNSCQYCRFCKCLQMGMKKEAVREDRSPGGKHRIKRQKVDDMQVTSDLGIIPETDSHEGFSDQFIELLVAARPDLCPKADSNTNASLRIDEMMQYGYTELKYIIEWAKKVPGFGDILVEDQMALLKSAFMELNVLRLSYRSMLLDNSIKFAEGLFVPVDVAQNMGWGRELIYSTMEFAMRLREINLDHTEFCILNAIVLTYPDAVGVQDKGRIIALQTSMLDALRRYMNHVYPNDVRRYGKMLLRLPTLRIVSAKAAERFLSLTLDGSIQLNELVLEMIN